MATKRKQASHQGEGEGYEEVPLEGGGFKRRRVGAKYWQRHCKHGGQKASCKECGGASICEHGRHRFACKECGGASICLHDRMRYRCQVCKAPKRQGEGPGEEGTAPPPPAGVTSMATTVVI